MLHFEVEGQRKRGRFVRITERKVMEQFIGFGFSWEAAIKRNEFG